MPARLAFRTILGSSENVAFETLPLKQCCLFARDRNRTCDLRVTSALLYQLSYTGGGLKLAPHWTSGNLLPWDGNHTLSPKARLQVIMAGMQVVRLVLQDMGQIARSDK